MQSSKQKNATKGMKSVTYLSIATNIGLSAIKLVVGLLTGSLALVADAIHSLSDLATDGAVLVGIYFGSKKPDQSHPYGHGRLETFAAAAVAIVLVLVGGMMIYHATLSIARDEATSFHVSVLIAAIVSVAAKEWLYQVTKRAAVQFHSSALYANAWHHRSDA
ncbi:MAG: cation transporter, partial [Sedimentisphaerales bacterium]|nr:cation transporter [Sedimentisphaerales bacterium]